MCTPSTRGSAAPGERDGVTSKTTLHAPPCGSSGSETFRDCVDGNRITRPGVVPETAIRCVTPGKRPGSLRRLSCSAPGSHPGRCQTACGAVQVSAYQPVTCEAVRTGPVTR